MGELIFQRGSYQIHHVSSSLPLVGHKFTTKGTTSDVRMQITVSSVNSLIKASYVSSDKAMEPKREN